MYAKLENGDDLYDHEVLEMLLYAVCPRVNTNTTAHNLLDRFCSISEIFKADVEELKTVGGVGENVARFLKTVGLCAERAGSVEGAAVLKTLGDCKHFISMRMRQKGEEYLELYFLQKNGKINRIFTYTSADRNKVFTKADEFIRQLALARPYGVIAAHNHLNGSAAPSGNDDLFTKQIQLICNMNSVKFIDHIIFSDGQFYSYRDEDKMGEIAHKYSLNKALEWIINTN